MPFPRELLFVGRIGVLDARVEELRREQRESPAPPEELYDGERDFEALEALREALWEAGMYERARAWQAAERARLLADPDFHRRCRKG